MFLNFTTQLYSYLCFCNPMLTRGKYCIRNTVNVEIFAQYIFSRISRRVLGALKYDVSEKINRYGASRNNCYMREDLST